MIWPARSGDPSRYCWGGTHYHAKGQLQRVDIGEVNGHPFFNVASIGFGVDLTTCALTRGSKLDVFGNLGYAIAALQGIVTGYGHSAPKSPTAPSCMSRAPFTSRSATAGTMAAV